MMRVVLTGGGTGGHVYPLIAVAKVLRDTVGAADLGLLYIGPQSPMVHREREAFTRENIPTTFIAAGKMRRYADHRNITDPFKTLWGIIQSLIILWREMPDVVFAKGGFGALPVVIAAWIYRIPVMIHESDAVPGIANLMMGKLATRIGITYHHATRYFPVDRTALVGIPIRPDIVDGDVVRARKDFGLRDDQKTIMVIGGSQGARAVNEAIIEILAGIHQHVQIIHQTGELHYDAVVHAAALHGVKAGREGYRPYAFLTSAQMGDALAVADLVISRAGASAIAEIAANKKASILVPLNLSANDHQRMNAYEIAKAGGAEVLEESNIGVAILSEKIQGLLADDALRVRMGENVAPFYHPHAAEHIAQGIIEMAQQA